MDRRSSSTPPTNPEGRAVAESDHLLFQGKVEVIAVYDREIRASRSVRLPSVLASSVASV